MNKLKQTLVSLAALLLFIGLGLSASVTAHTDRPVGDKTENSEILKVKAQTLADKFRQQARIKVTEERAKVRAQTHEKRQMACETRKDGLERKMNRSVAQAKKHKAVFDKISNRVQDFYEDNNLNVSEYDSLKANVDAAHESAEASITALETLDVELDCTQQNVADGVSSFREALKATRDSLKDYRKALVDLINSIKGASTSTDKPDNSTTTDSSTNNQAGQ